jgi:transglutaminase-like putative cysteine protease
MKKSNLLSLAAGLLLGAVIFGGISAGAANLTQTISATYKDIKIYIDRTLIAPKDANGAVVEPFISNGTTYLPVRAVAEVLGKEVSWDSGTNSVYIGAQPTAAPTPNAEIPGGTAVDYSLQANPVIFDNYYTREKYNADRQRVLDTGEIATGWGIFAPTSVAAVDAANRFFDGLVGQSDLEKIYRISDFLCTHLTYNKSESFNGNEFFTGTAYGVCEDYAQEFRYMCWRAGLPCLYVTGTVDGNSHAWNEVYIDDVWQHYDGDASDKLQTIALGDAVKQRHVYTDDSPNGTRFNKEVYVPGSTL